MAKSEFTSCTVSWWACSLIHFRVFLRSLLIAL